MTLRAKMAGRFGPHVWLKGIGTTLFITLFFIAYFEVQQVSPFHVTVVPLTAIDHWIPFQPLSLPLYASLWLYVSLPPAFLVTRRSLYRYGLTVGSMCFAGLACFYFWPTATPPFHLDWRSYPGFGFLKDLDTSRNACPSLHVATAVFSWYWLHAQIKGMGGTRRAMLVNLLWCAGIVYSTLATKQHVAIDAGAGILLAWVWLAGAGWLGIRPWPEEGDGIKMPAPVPD